MAAKVLIFGGEEAGIAIATYIMDANRDGHTELDVHGFLNDRTDSEEISGYPVYSDFEEIPRFIDEGYQFINTIYKVDGQLSRIRLFESHNIPDSSMATFVHPSANVSTGVEIGHGSIILPYATISANTKLGKCNRIAPHTYVGHDCVLGDHTFFGPQATLGSGCTTGKAAYLGIGGMVMGKTRIAEYSVVGMGSVVTNDVGPYEIVVGNPARFHRFVADRPDAK